MTSERTCYVYIMLPGTTEFVTAGRFDVSPTVGGEPVGRFTYGRRYRESPDAVEFDPVELRLRRGIFETALLEGFFGAIRDAMPDHWGRRIIERRAGIPELEEFDYLLRGPDDRAGALGFGETIDPPPPSYDFNRTIDLNRLQRDADAVIANDREIDGSSESRVEELLLMGTSLGGARPKASIEDGNSLWVAKFSRPDDRWNHPRVEHGLLNLARRCGIDAAHSELADVGGRTVLLVERFDREWAGEAYQRRRMVSALTLLRTTDSPTSRTEWSYLLLADELRRHSVRGARDLRELFKRMCFNAAVSNTDDHPRNHAVLGRGRGWQLSPAYDLTPSPMVAQDRRDLAMQCGRAGRYANRQNLLSECGRFGLERDEAESILGSIVGTVRSEWRKEMLGAGATEKDLRMIESAFLYRGFDYESDGLSPA